MNTRPRFALLAATAVVALTLLSSCYRETCPTYNTHVDVECTDETPS